MTAFGKENMTNIVLYLYKPFLVHFFFIHVYLCVCGWGGYAGHECVAIEQEVHLSWVLGTELCPQLKQQSQLLNLHQHV